MVSNHSTPVTDRREQTLPPAQPSPYGADSPSSEPLVRRDFLASVCAGFALFAAPWSSAGASTFDYPAPALAAFLEAASALTGIAIDDREQATRYFKVLHDSLGAERVRALADAAGLAPDALLPASRFEPLRSTAEFAMNLWLTGMVPNATGEASVLDYTDALVWNALPFTKPPGRCGGAFGYWADPPAEP
jgi:hypothetical protein